jgi:hypothetical protein
MAANEENNSIQRLTQTALDAFEKSWWGNLPGEKQDGMYVGVEKQIEDKQTDALTPRKAAYNLLVLFRKANGQKDGLQDKRIDINSDYLKAIKEITTEEDRLALLVFKQFMKETLENLADYGSNSNSFVRSIIQSTIKKKIEESNKLILEKMDAYNNLAALEAREKQLNESIKNAKTAEAEKELESLQNHIAEIRKAEAEKQKAEAEKQKPTQDVCHDAVINALNAIKNHIQRDDKFVNNLRTNSSAAMPVYANPVIQANVTQAIHRVLPPANTSGNWFVSTVTYVGSSVTNFGASVLSMGASLFRDTQKSKQKSNAQLRTQLVQSVDKQIQDYKQQAAQSYLDNVRKEKDALKTSIHELSNASQSNSGSWWASVKNTIKNVVTNGIDAVKRIYHLSQFDKLLKTLNVDNTYAVRFLLVEAERLEKYLVGDKHRSEIVESAKRLRETQLNAEKFLGVVSPTSKPALSSTNQVKGLLTAPVATMTRDDLNMIRKSQEAAKLAQHHAAVARTVIAKSKAKTAPARLLSASAAVPASNQKTTCTNTTKRRLR